MIKKIIALAAVLLITFFTGIAFSAPVNIVDYGTLTGTELIDFEDLPQIAGPGTNYDSVFISGGAAFAERFVGQTLSISGYFDILSGTPDGSLTLQVGAAGQNIDIFAGTYGGVYGNILNGLGYLGFPDGNAVGEGAFAVLFSTDQSQFGFKLVGGNGGNAYIDFFRRDGSLIDSITVSGLADLYYGFEREGGIQDIAGISIYNDDFGGIALDDLKHDVESSVTLPEPTTMLLLGFGLIALAGFRRKA